MPPPKDPRKLAEYRKKMRRIALERGYGKWMEGKRMSPESIEKTRQANVGKVISEEHKDALSAARRRDIAEGRELFGGEQGRIKARDTTVSQRKGNTYARIYGPDRAEEEAQKRRESNRVRHIDKPVYPTRREKHNADYRYVEWRKAVFEHDDYTCRTCGRRGGTLHAHHIRGWAEYPTLRFEVSNGLTLCASPCHKEKHFSTP